MRFLFKVLLSVLVLAGVALVGFAVFTELPAPQEDVVVTVDVG